MFEDSWDRNPCRFRQLEKGLFAKGWFGDVLRCVFFNMKESIFSGRIWRDWNIEHFINIKSINDKFNEKVSKKCVCGYIKNR